MGKTSWMVHFAIGMLGSTPVIADDSNASYSDPESTRTASVAVEALLAESPYLPGWQLRSPGDGRAGPARWPQAMREIDFKDGSALARLSKLRNLSLLTLAESPQTRLYLGVNADGLPGLHFVAFGNHRDERFLTLARIPWLRQQEPRIEDRLPAPAVAGMH